MAGLRHLLRQVRTVIAEKSARDIYQTAAALAVADIAAKGAGAVLALLIARFLGPHLYGRYATALAICSLIMMAADLGFDRELIRRGGRNPDSVSESVVLSWASILLAAGAGALVVAVIVQTERYDAQVNRLMWLMLIALSLAQCNSPLRALCLVWRRAGVNAVVQLASTTLLLVATAIALVQHAPLEVIVVLQGLTAAAVLVFWFTWLPQRFFSEVRSGVATWLHFIRSSLPFGLSNILWIAYFNFATFLLSVFQSQTEVGTYAGVYRLIGINYVLGYALASSFTPVLFKARTSQEYAVDARRLILTALGGGVLLCVGLLVSSPWLVAWTIGDEYRGGVRVAQVLSLAVFFRVMNYGFGEILTTSNLQGLKNRLELGLLTANGLMNLLLIPRFGALGAAASTVFSELLLFVLLYRTARRRQLQKGVFLPPTTAS